MNNKQKFYVLGSGWLSAYGSGMFGSRPQFSTTDTQFHYPELERLIPELPARFGRFDVYTKVAFSTAVLALHDAQMAQREGQKRLGVVVGSYSGVYDNDLAYYATTQDNQGEYTSPNLFSYTLPNVAVGEIAVYFKIAGPTFCLGNDPVCPGSDVLPVALTLLESGQCDRILAGWVEISEQFDDQKNVAKGAALAVLSLEPSTTAKTKCTLTPQFDFNKLFEAAE